MNLARMLRGQRPRQLPPQEAYRLWAESYPPWAHNSLMEAEQAVVEPIVVAAKPRRALDVGTGTGRCLPILSGAGARLVVGVDLSLAMLRQASFDAHTLCADACRLPFADGSFDFVSSSLMAGDVEDLGAWVRESARVLARGGTLLYSDFHPSWVEQGWKRTFRASDGELIELPFHPHTIEQHLALLSDSNLSLCAIREPRIPSAAAPVVAVFHAVKPR
jgi:ubiquinone/menaquinone biosynthesis C-methylase UbiE